MPPPANPVRSDRRALVIGAGIGGLATAIALRQAGWDVAVHERAADVTEVGAGLSLWANAVRALERLGVGPMFLSRARALGSVGLYTSDGMPLLLSDAEGMRRRYGELVVAVHRTELLHTLLAALDPQVVRSNRTCVDFIQDATGVTAHFADGSSDRGDILIGADGIHSAVRAQLHGAAPARYAGYSAWRAVVSFDGAPVRACEAWGAGTRFGMVPLTDGRVYWFATTNAPAGTRSPDGERAELRRTFGHWFAPVPAMIEATDARTILRNDIVDRPPLSWWGRGRVTLVGDAAHAMTPNLGQGACQALEDAVVLGDRLAKHGDVAAALQAYERIRLPRANRFVRQSYMAGWIGQWSNPAAVWLRATIMRAFGPQLRARQVAEVLAHGL